MKNKKIVPFIVLVLLVCMPFASAQIFGLTDVPYSPLTNAISIEEMVLYGGLTPKDIGVQNGKPCIKPGVKPGLSASDPADNYLVPLSEMRLPKYGLAPDLELLKEQNKRLHKIIDMVDNAVSDDSVQQYKVFAGDPLYQNTDYGMYFTTIVDALTFSVDAMKTIGKLHDSVATGAIWLDYGYMTSSPDIKVAFKDYAQTSLMFNGLMEQMQSNSELEDAVDYAADVLGSQMQQQAQAGNNIFKAHENLDIAGDSMNRAQDFFDKGDVAGAVGKSNLETKMDFFGMMNMAEGLYSMGESYKLKAMVLLMLLDGTFRGGVGIQRKLGASLGPPCDIIPVPPCKGCPPGYYVFDPYAASASCFAGSGVKAPPQIPGGVIFSGSPAGGVVADSAESNTEGLFPIFRFPLEQVRKKLDMSGWEIPAYPEVPEEYEVDKGLLVQENLESANIAKDALVRIASADVKINPEVYVDGVMVTSETFVLNGNRVNINRETGEFVDEAGNAVTGPNPEFAQDYIMYGRAKERLRNLDQVVGYEAGRLPIYEQDRQTYLQAKTEELTIRLDAIDREYKYQLKNIRADPDLSFMGRNDQINALYAVTNKDLIKAIESTITDDGVKRFTYLIPDKDAALMELLDQRDKTDAYSEITAINVKILEITYPDTGIAGYYEHLKEQNMPFKGI